MARDFYLAAYDIADAQRLQNALFILKNYASGGQKSVFECFLDRAERLTLMDEIRAVLDLQEDRFLLLPLADSQRIEVLGIAVKPTDEDYFYVG